MSEPAKKLSEDEAYADFMSRAYTMELEAVERYAQFADQLDTHNNPEVAQLFRKLSEIESLHAKRILAEMRWPSLPALPAAYAWEGVEGPETAPFDAVVQILDGEAEITIAGTVHRVGVGELLIMPAHQPHALRAVQPFKMLLTMIRA